MACLVEGEWRELHFDGRNEGGCFYRLFRQTLCRGLGLVDLPVLITSIAGSVVDDPDGWHNLACFLCVVVVVQSSSKSDCVGGCSFVVDEELEAGLSTRLRVDHVDAFQFSEIKFEHDTFDVRFGGVGKSARDNH